jgi:hypothetical protein
MLRKYASGISARYRADLISSLLCASAVRIGN